jgi:LPS-assembly lipoprotein
MSSLVSYFNLRSAGFASLAPRILTILVSGFWLLVSGCGFHPMYGADSAGGNSAMRGNIVIDPMPGHEGQIFKTALEDKFNPESLSTVNAEYRLHTGLTKTVIPTVVKSDGTIQRYDVRFDSDFKLFRTGAPVPVLTGKLRRTGSYNVAINANFATYEAEEDIIERTLQEMAEDYVMRISGYLAAKPEAPAKPQGVHIPQPG